jgi:hypothetical protein
LTAAEAVPDLAITVQVCIALAEIAVECGDSAAAVRHARHAVDICQQTRNLSDEARASEVLGTVLFAAGDTAEAAQAWQHAAAIYERTGNRTRALLVGTRVAKLPTRDLDLPTSRSDSTSPDLATRHDTIGD